MRDASTRITPFMEEYLLQVQHLVLHFLQRSQQFGLVQPRLLQLRLQVADKLLCVLTEKKNKNKTSSSKSVACRLMDLRDL